MRALSIRLTHLRASHERLRAKNLELEISRERYVYLYNLAPIGYVCFDQAGTIREINHQVAKLLDEPVALLLRQSFARHVASADLCRFFDHLRRCAERRGQVISELRIRRPNGIDEIPVELLSIPLPSSIWPGSVIFHTIVTDVTERKRIESALGRNQLRLQLALNAANAGVWELDLVTGLASWSDEFCRLLGRSPQLTLPSYDTLLNCIHPMDVAAAKRTFNQILRRRSNLRVEFRVCHPGERIRWLGMVGHVNPGQNGGPTTLCGIGIDITERRRAEEWLRKSSLSLEQQVRERTAELRSANVELERQIRERVRLERQILEVGERERQRIGQDLHDGLGQHLTGIRFYASALHEKLARKSLPEAADSQHLSRLLQEAKAQTRNLARGLLPVASVPDGLMTALRQLTENVSELHGITCRFDCPQPVLIADVTVATHLFRIAQEAVANAIEHARPRNIHLALRANNGAVQIQVHNDRHARRPNHSHVRGLGLQIMKSRSEAIGGVLEVCRDGPGSMLVHCSVPLPKKGQGGSKNSSEVPPARPKAQRIADL